MTDLYADLNLDAERDRGIDQAALRKAFRARAKQVHPDNQATGDAGAFRRAQTALAILSDPKRKQRYDAGGGFDESEVDNGTAAALDLLSQAIEKLIDDERTDVDGTDLVAMLTGILQAADRQLQELIEPLRRKLARREKAARRFKRKAGGRGFVDQLLAEQVRKLRGSIAQYERTRVAAARAQEIVAESTYQFEPPPPQSHQYSYQRFIDELVARTHRGGGVV